MYMLEELKNPDSRIRQEKLEARQQEILDNQANVKERKKNEEVKSKGK